jgi:uncharacterized membrane protein YedE/YeeE
MSADASAATVVVPMPTPVLLGLLLGTAVGALMSRGTVCFNAGVRRAAFEGDKAILRTFGLAVGVQLLLLPVLVLAGVGPLARAVDGGQPALLPLAQVAGGLVFGVGMALAGGCIAGILWKSGAGSLATAVAIAGFAAGELIARDPAGPLLAGLKAAKIPGQSSLHHALGVPYSLAAGVLGIVLLGALLRGSSRRTLGLGAGLGLLGVLAWIAAAASGYGYGLGFVGTAANVRDTVEAADFGALSFEVFLAFGVIVGAAVAIRGPLRLPDTARAGRALVGGLLMGFGANVADGCNIGHGLTGIPLLSFGSVLAVGCMTLGALATRRFGLVPWPALRGTERPEPSW